MAPSELPKVPTRRRRSRCVSHKGWLWCVVYGVCICHTKELSRECCLQGFWSRGCNQAFPPRPSATYLRMHGLRQRAKGLWKLFPKFCIDEGRIVFTTVVELSYSCYMVPVCPLPVTAQAVRNICACGFRHSCSNPKLATSGHASKEAPGDVLFLFRLAVQAACISKRHMRDEHS